MATIVVMLAIVVVCTAAGIRIGRRSGMPGWSEWDPGRRRLVVLVAAVYLVLMTAIGLAFATEHPTIGVALIILGFIGPELAWIPRRIRRASRRGNEHGTPST